jgi:beta-glucosidase/6-phospho-beta-glucosidase/beta-galactosidase
MIRVVALRKAAVAGVAGAAVWELVLGGLVAAGVPTFDIVRLLGMLAFPDGPTLAWWAAGMAAHALVGICWALFYAHFFWARFDWPPAIQGMVFSLLPAVLALLIMAPQLHLAQIDTPVVELNRALLLPALTPLQIGGLVLGHLIFGLTVGLIYTRPVGYRAGNGSALGTAHFRPRRSSHESRRQNGSGFIFATGIECSYPTLEQGRWRLDQMAATLHYQRWQEDFELSREIGVTHLRYGPPLHLIYRAPGRFEWELIDEAMADLEQYGPEPIVDLCHFGVPAWLGNFQNPDIASALGEYAGAFAERYPWVRFYTPVNEMYVCARSSALEGAWNEQLRDEKAFLTAVFNLAGASVRMADVILAHRRDAIFVNSESSEFYQPCCPDRAIQDKAELENQRGFLTLDLIFAHEVGEPMLARLRDHGFERDYHRFLGREVPKRSILGVDYYEWNERLIDQNGSPRALGELFGWYVIASHYYDRYKRTMMHTETNRLDASDAPRWLWRQWHNVQLLRRAGVPLIGFTWYSLTDQIDWEIGLTRANGTVDPVGLFDLNRDPRPVGLSFRHLIDMHKDQPGFVECEPLKELMD